MCSGKESEYVFFSLETCLQSKTNCGNLCPLKARSSNTDALVAKLPFLVFLRSAIFIILSSYLAFAIKVFLPIIIFQFLITVFSILIYIVSLRENEKDFLDSDLNIDSIKSL